ncbi:MAG TPA: hypothetical protein VGN88_03005, partial [Phycisphaerae bacterium]
IVGDRFFPATIAVDDPLVTDELMLPSLSLAYMPASDEGPETRAIATGFEFNKVIVPKLAIGVSDDYVWLHPRHAPAAKGWDNLTLSLKYEVWRDEAHEAIISVGLETEIGGTGSKSAGRAAFSTFTPTVYFGKGFGDLPDSLNMLKPLALTGAFGLNFPGEAQEANSVEWGFSLEYSLPYLQQHVRDMKLPEPFKNMIPLVEFAFETPLNRGEHGFTTGTVNPGILWESRYFQVGVEAVIPINHASGTHLGAMVQFQIFIDDLLPHYFGHPIFGD